MFTDLQSNRIGIMGGSFDPPHAGHIHAACAAATQMQLSKVYFLPSFGVFKSHTPASIEHRLAMMHLVCRDYANFCVDEFDAQQMQGTKTIKTLMHFAKMHPQKELYFIAGSDAINTLKTWDRYMELFKFAKFIAIGRPGFDLDLEYLRDILQYICILNTQTPAISSTLIRSHIAKNLGLKDLVPKAVEEYIIHNKLYTNRETSDRMAPV